MTKANRGVRTLKPQAVGLPFSERCLHAVVPRMSNVIGFSQGGRRLAPVPHAVCEAVSRA